jgi:hypothetical protein
MLTVGTDTAGNAWDCGTEVTWINGQINLARMTGVAVIQRSAGTVEALWAISGLDKDAINAGTIQTNWRSRNGKYAGMNVNRASYTSTADQRTSLDSRSYVKDKTTKQIVPVQMGAATFTYVPATGNSDTGHWSKTQGQNTDLGNNIGVCAGAKLAMAMSSSYAGSSALAAGDKVVCFAEINYNVNSVTVRSHDGTNVVYANGAVTPSCVSCQKQILDLLS